ncbi:MAG TPA: hypothetical protein VJI71_02345, partial [Candidatus Norongarragalinales archaeon]|nr:hypothetical protein [Candidatus Norongarragalinales archaeon]
CYRENQRPLLYGFWGGHKESESGIADQNDHLVMQRLAWLSRRMAQSGLRPPELRIIFADTHALLNGVDKKRIEAYYKSLLPLAKKHGLKLVRLSKLEKTRSWKKEAERVDYRSGLEWVLSKRNFETVEAQVQRVLGDPAKRKALEEDARKHSMRFQKGEVDLGKAVEDYVRKRVVEGRVLGRLPNWEGIHFAFAQPTTLGSMMSLKTLFLHPMQQGRPETPWFTPGKPLAKKEVIPFKDRLKAFGTRFSLQRKQRLAFQAKPK